MAQFPLVQWATLAALMAILAGCVPVTQPAFAYPVTVIPTECPLRVPDELEEGQTIVCGRLRLPQDRSDPQGLQVELPFALVEAESAHPEPDPLVYVVGGPGGSALAEFDEVYGWFRSLRRDRDLVIYDQRGTLLATPVLDCATAAAAPDLAQEQVRAASLVPAAYGPLDANDLGILRCADQLHAQGIDLSRYDTPTHAQDLLDLMQALGYTTFNLYATSYGTRIGLEVMRLAPSRLRAAVLDSVLPPQANTYEWQTVLGRDEVLRHALALCDADDICAAASPNLSARFAALVTRLDAAPLTLPLEWQPVLAGSDLRYLLYGRLDAAVLPYLPRLVEELEKGETTTLLELLTGALPMTGASPVPTTEAPPKIDERVNEEAVLAFVMQINGAYYLQSDQLGLEARAEWQQLTARNPDRTRLQRFIKQYLPAAEAQLLLAALASLSDADVALVFAEMAGTPAHPIVVGANLAVECRDEVPFNDFATAMTAHRSMSLPDALVMEEMTQLRHRWAQCALFPTGVAAPAQTLPVHSSVPVLILQGGLDRITPLSWAVSAQRSLPRAHLLEFPSAGHEVMRGQGGGASSCPARLARAFLAAPNRIPDASCITDNR